MQIQLRSSRSQYNARLFASQCKQFFRKHVGKTAEQNQEPVEGCEGCGNPGFIQFGSEAQAAVLFPGDDQVWSCTGSFTSVSTYTMDCGFTAPLELTFAEDCGSVNMADSTFYKE
jgi:pyruvate/2-oxoacid:ferredoxin oxidoreductase beta subunit